MCVLPGDMFPGRKPGSGSLKQGVHYVAGIPCPVCLVGLNGRLDKRSPTDRHVGSWQHAKCKSDCILTGCCCYEYMAVTVRVMCTCHGDERTSICTPLLSTNHYLRMHLPIIVGRPVEQMFHWTTRVRSPHTSFAAQTLAAQIDRFTWQYWWHDIVRQLYTDQLPSPNVS